MKYLSFLFEDAVSDVTEEQISAASKALEFVAKQYGDKSSDEEQVRLNMIAHDSSGDEFS